MTRMADETTQNERELAALDLLIERCGCVLILSRDGGTASAFLGGEHVTVPAGIRVEWADRGFGPIRRVVADIGWTQARFADRRARERGMIDKRKARERAERRARAHEGLVAELEQRIAAADRIALASRVAEALVSWIERRERIRYREGYRDGYRAASGGAS